MNIINLIKMMHICMYKNYVKYDEHINEIIEGSDIKNICFNVLDYTEIIDMYGINFQNNDGDTALIKACEYGNFEVVKLLLGVDGINVNIQNKKGDTALICICNMHGWHETKKKDNEIRAEIVKLLLGVENIDVNIRGYDGFTALISACIGGYKNVFKSLLEVKDINVNIQDEDGDTAFILCDSYQIFSMLMEREDVDVNIQNNQGETKLMTIPKLRDDRHIMTEILMKSEKYIDMNLQDENGDTAFMISCGTGEFFNSKFLLERKKDININIQNKKGFSALMLACHQGSLDTVKMLLNLDDIDINLKNEDGRTAIDIAELCKTGDWDRAWDPKGYNEYYYSTHYPKEGEIYDKIYSLLQVKHIVMGNKIEPFVWACICDDLPMVKKLLEEDASRIKTTLENETVLIWACRCNCLETVKFLLKCPNIDLDARSRFGGNCFTTAVEFGRIDIVEFLLKDDRINFNVACDEGYTPFLIAFYGCNEELIDILLESGKIDFHAVTDDGETCLSLVERNDMELYSRIMKNIPESSNI